MMIEVTGVSTRNKGAELMLIAIQQHYAAAPFGTLKARPTLVVDRWFGSYEERAQYGLSTKLGSFKAGRSALAAKLMPASFRRAHGLVNEADVDAVLDASGFAFGDQHPPERTEEFAACVRKWKGAGKRVVLLPQALGPFENPRIANAFAEVCRLADLVYARDATSLAHVERIAPADANVKLSPDFTNLVCGPKPADLDLPESLGLIVPNHRMIEKTSGAERDAYLPFLAACAAEMASLDVVPQILLHDTDADETLVAPLQAAMQKSLGRELPVLRERCPRRLKGILGAAKVVVGSRFHALIGALSQGAPCIAAGWSHKYQELLADYGCPENMLPVVSERERISELLTPLLVEPGRSEKVAQLKAAAERERERARHMWRQVDEVLQTAPAMEEAR